MRRPDNEDKREVETPMPFFIHNPFANAEFGSLGGILNIFLMLKNKFLLWLTVLFSFSTVMSYAQGNPDLMKKKNGPKKEIYYEVPWDYQQIGDTKLYSRITDESIDIYGDFNGVYYGSTYADYGYFAAMQVGDSYAGVTPNGTMIDGVFAKAAIVAQGELARIDYTIKNTNSSERVISFGIYADVQIGENDSAPIERRIDTEGNTYGLTMMDGNGAQMCALFGSGLTGVTAADDYWFGNYGWNSDAYNIVGNYDYAENWMVENGEYDSAMGWCWKNRTIPAGETIVFSFILGIGDINFVPSSSFEVASADLETWNDLSVAHPFVATGYYASPFGQNGYLEYAVEDSEEWIRIESPISSHTNFTKNFSVMFNPERSSHKISFRITDYVGNMTMLPSVEYMDVTFYPVTGFEDKTYTGYELTQSNLSYDFGDTEWTATYKNNVNVGTAYYVVEGVYPNSIGCKEYPFTINPQPLEGDLNVSGHYAYNGNAITPTWNFTVDRYNALESGEDYDVALLNNVLPGAATLTVMGKGNYTGSLTTDFIIEKGVITPAIYALTLPESPVEYDGLPHGASVVVIDGVGAATITYTPQGGSDFTTDAPIGIGKYDIYLEIAESDLYKGLDKTLVGEVEIVEGGSLPDNPDPADVPDVTISTISDNSNMIGEYNEQTVNATIEGLAMLPNKWNTLCLPFDATLEQAKEALGEGVDIEELVRSTYNEETKLLTLYFTPRLFIQAGMPYVVKVASDITNPVFKGVTIKNVDPITITTDYSSMTGDYNPTVMVVGDKNTLFISNNHFYYPSSTGPLPATKCWFTLLGAAQEDAVDNGVKGIEISFDGDASTAIYSITETVNNDDAYYTLQGIRVMNPTRGVYIHRGEKIIIK